MELKDGAWMYHIGESEVWTGEYYESKALATEAGLEEYHSDLEAHRPYDLLVGQVNLYETRLRAEHLLDSIRDDAWDDLGEVADNYLSCSEEQENELDVALNQVFQDWLQKHFANHQMFTIEKAEVVETAHE